MDPKKRIAEKRITFADKLDERYLEDYFPVISSIWGHIKGKWKTPPGLVLNVHEKIVFNKILADKFIIEFIIEYGFYLTYGQ